MTKYRVRITKVLEDGTELEMVNVVDQPWYVAAVLIDWVSRLRRIPRPPVEANPAQLTMGEAA